MQKQSVKCHSNKFYKKYLNVQVKNLVNKIINLTKVNSENILNVAFLAKNFMILNDFFMFVVE